MIVYLPKSWRENKPVRDVLPVMKKHLIDLTNVYNVVYLYTTEGEVFTNETEHCFILNKLVKLYLGNIK